MSIKEFKAMEAKRIKEYRVYEIGKDCRKHGVVVGTYKTKKTTEKKWPKVFIDTSSKLM